MREDQENSPLPMILSEDSITLGLNGSSFEDFVVSLLGKPDVLEGFVEGGFEVNASNVKDLYYKIDNKIIQQNDAVLLEFKSELFFDDDSKVSFNEIDKLINIDETRSIVCTGFNFTWSYLIQFSKEKAPERQEISIFANTNYNDQKKKRKRPFILELFSLDTFEMPRVSYSIRCTVKTWGHDLAGLVKGALESNVVNQAFLSNIRINLIKASTPFFYFVWLCVYSRLMETVSHIQSQKVADIEGVLGDNIDISVKLDRLLLMGSEILSQRGSYVISIMVLSVVIVGLSYLFVCYLLRPPIYEFILFTDRSKLEKKIFLGRQKKLILLSIIGLLMNVLYGVVANYIFQFLSR